MYNDDIPYELRTFQVNRLSDRIVTCPRCGFKFSISYARAYACTSCPVLIYDRRCSYVKCPRCNHEFLLEQF